MKSFITRDKFVAEGESRHEGTFLKPEDGTERSTEEYTLHSCKSHQSLMKGFLMIHPLDCPLCFLSDDIYIRDSTK
jgi:hypothetical protein